MEHRLSQESETVEEVTLATGETLYYIYPIGLLPGAIISSETIRKAKEAEERYQEKQRNKRTKPPKPPSRPNARIGGLALGNT